MQIQWEKVPDRLDSNALKCLLCAAMATRLEETDDFNRAFAQCCSLMFIALTMNDDAEVFKDRVKLVEAIAELGVGEVPKDTKKFLQEHHEYILECTERVLKRVRDCPEKEHNKARR